MENMEENCEMIWKLWKKSNLKSEKILKNMEENSEKIWKIQKKGKLNSEKI
jgi:hypothetical protein